MKNNKSPIRQQVQTYLELGIDVTLNNRDIELCDSGINSIKENSCYMKEYVRDGKGNLKQINFTMIKKNK